MSRRLSLAILLILLTTFFAMSAFADEELALDASHKANIQRTFVPVQAGFSKTGQTALPYAPNRLLVQIKSDAMALSTVANLNDKGAQAFGNEIGLESLDFLADVAGVVSVERPYIRVKNLDKAADLGVDRWLMYRFENVRNLEDLAAQFRADKSVQAVSLDWIAYPAAVPSDPLYPDHWGHNNTAQLPDLDWGGTYGHTLSTTVGTPGFDTNAQAAWDGSQGYGSAGVVVAILDSGVEAGHPDLRQVAGYDYGDNDSNPDDNSSDPGHGTACAGIAASMNNSLGSAGIAAGCSIMPLKVADSAGSMFFSAIQNAIYHAADNGADVISMSFGAAISSDSATDAALLYAYNKGVTMFAATGNENASTISYPAINQYVIGVGAASPCGDRKRSGNSSEVNPGVNTDPNGYTCDGERWWGSNYGVNTQDAAGAVDILAPTILPTTDLLGSAGYESGDYSSFFNGTSCATPYAAGVAALVISKNPTFTPAQVRDAIVTTAQDITNVESGSGWDRYSGYGMIDAAAAVGSGGSTPVAPTAAFSGTPTSGTTPLSVTFADASTGQPTSWSWTFGDGANSTAQNPSHTYTTAGTFTVAMTATNAQGSDTMTKNGYITATDPANNFATLPYSTGFESGAVDQYWVLYEGGSEGRILVTTANTPHSGSYQLTMDDKVNGGSYSQNEGWLQLNLAGEGQVDLDFWWKDFSDETHSLDGVYFSDNGGSSFVKVLDLNGASYTDNVWQNFTVDVDAEAAGAGLSLTSNFVIKFQQYDNYGITTDGMAFDDISVTAGAAGVAPVAAFSGAPTSGTAPLAVAFSDASTNAPTSWSWAFGDGATSTAQNPSHSYASAGTYNVELTVSNAFGSDNTVKTNYITVDAPTGGGTWVDITYDDFEGGLGSYTDGGRDCKRYSGSRSYQGSYSMDIQDNSGTRSSFYHTVGHDVSSYVDLEVEFFFYAYSMDNSNEDFWLQYYDGSSWQTVATWAQGIDFDNKVFYTTTVQIPAGSYNYATNAKIRFMCDASGNADDVYIDQITFRGLTASGAGSGLADGQGEVGPMMTVLNQNSPNPFNPMTEIKFSLKTAGQVRLNVYNVRGELVESLANGELAAGSHRIMWDARDKASGVYFYRLEAPDFTQTRKMIMLK